MKYTLYYHEYCRYTDVPAITIVEFEAKHDKQALIKIIKKFELDKLIPNVIEGVKGGYENFSILSIANNKGKEFFYKVKNKDNILFDTGIEIIKHKSGL